MRQKLFLAAFLLFLLLPALQQATGLLRVQAVNEHRAKVAWPAGGLVLGPALDKGYTAKVEAWFADHFPLRDLFLRLHGQLEYSLLGVAREVIVGQDGWLSDKKLLAEHLQQLDRIDEKQIEAGILQLKRLQHWLQARDVRFLMVIVPLKPTVYPEKFPTKYRRSANRTGIAKFQEALALNDIPYIDLETEFRRRKGAERLFYMTDMHWNSVGISVAAESIVDRLSTEMLGRKIWAEQLTKTNTEFQGEELRAIPLLLPRPERTPLWTAKDGGYQKLPMTQPNLEVYRGLDARRALLPPSIMFGNSFMLGYPEVGYHNYFSESSRVLDYQYFAKVLDWVKPQHRILVLHIYETQLQYHVMPTGRAGVWSGFAQYWDPRIEQLPLPPGFRYRGPDL